MVHMSDISWADEGEASVREFKKGDELETVILAVDSERERISLGIKQLEQDPFQNFLATNEKGSFIKGVIKEVDAKGAVVILADHVEGYLRGWVSVASNEEIMELAKNDTADFWEEWNSCRLKPRVRLGGKDRVNPSFSMMKELQSASLKKLLYNPLEYLLRKMEDEDVGFDTARTAAFNIILQECRSFDWPAIVDGLVELLGGVEGWMEGAGCEVIGGLVIYKL